MKKGLIMLSMLGLVVLAGCYHNEETKDGASTEQPAVEQPAADTTK